jgi:hypothetical protein
VGRGGLYKCVVRVGEVGRNQLGKAWGSGNLGARDNGSWYIRVICRFVGLPLVIRLVPIGYGSIYSHIPMATILSSLSL